MITYINIPQTSKNQKLTQMFFRFVEIFEDEFNIIDLIKIAVSELEVSWAYFYSTWVY